MSSTFGNSKRFALVLSLTLSILAPRLAHAEKYSALCITYPKTTYDDTDQRAKVDFASPFTWHVDTSTGTVTTCSRDGACKDLESYGWRVMVTPATGFSATSTNFGGTIDYERTPSHMEFEKHAHMHGRAITQVSSTACTEYPE